MCTVCAESLSAVVIVVPCLSVVEVRSHFHAERLASPTPLVALDPSTLLWTMPTSNHQRQHNDVPRLAAPLLRPTTCPTPSRGRQDAQHAAEGAQHGALRAERHAEHLAGPPLLLRQAETGLALRR